MSRKLISVLLITMLSLSVVGCGDKKESNAKNETSTVTTDDKYENLDGEWAEDLNLDKLEEKYDSLLSEIEEKNRYYGLEYENEEGVKDTDDQVMNEEYLYLENEKAEKNRLESLYFALRTYGDEISKGQIVMKLALNFDGEKAIKEKNFDFGETSLATYSAIFTGEEDRDYTSVNEEILKVLQSEDEEGIIKNNINGLYEEFIICKDYIIYRLETKKFNFATENGENNN